MGWNYKDEELAMTIEITQGEEEMDTNDIYYKLIEVSLDEKNPITRLEKKVNKYINKASDNFMPSGVPFIVPSTSATKPAAKIVQVLVDIDEL